MMLSQYSHNKIESRLSSQLHPGKKAVMDPLPKKIFYAMEEEVTKTSLSAVVEG